MDVIQVDINCDAGEGIADEKRIFPFINSCSIACGGHAGNLSTMTKSVELALENNLKIGAHPSYPDKDNFGRVSMKLSSKNLQISILHQLKNLETVLGAKGVKLHHIKAHGALYNDMAKDTAIAAVYLTAITEYKNSAFLYVPYNSVVANMALEQGFKIKYEAFADRNYNDDLSLVSRKNKNSLILEPENVLSHVLQIAKNKTVVTVEGNKQKLIADTFCVHGDTINALEIVSYIRQMIPNHNTPN